MKPNYRSAFEELAGVLNREAAPNLCLVHAGARPSFCDGPDDYKDTATWTQKSRQALRIAASHGLDFVVSWKVTKFERWNLWSRDREFDTSKMRAYELGEALGFPEGCLGQSAILKYENYGFHLLCGRVDVVSFVSWHFSEPLMAEATRMATNFESVVREHGLPFGKTRVVVFKFAMSTKEDGTPKRTGRMTFRKIVV